MRNHQHKKSSYYERGVTFIEIMGVLAVAALITYGAVVIYDTTTTRQKAQSIVQGLSPFFLDMARYLNVDHQEASGSITEGTFETYSAVGSSVNATLSKMRPNTWSGTSSATSESVEVSYTSKITDTKCPDGLTRMSTLNFTAGTTECTGSYGHMRRFVSMSSVKFTDTNDADGQAEWSIVSGANEGYDFSFAINPPAPIDSGAGSGRLMDDIANGNDCPHVSNTNKPDTAVVVEIIVDDLDVCEATIPSLEDYDIVEEAFCLDGSSTGTWRFGTTAANQPPDGEAALHICFGVV